MGLLILALFLFQEPSEDPHANQPASCDNYHDTPESHKCACARATVCRRDPNAAEDSKCKTYCRKENCKCVDPCSTHRRAVKRKGEA